MKQMSFLQVFACALAIASPGMEATIHARFPEATPLVLAFDDAGGRAFLLSEASGGGQWLVTRSSPQGDLEILTADGKLGASSWRRVRGSIPGDADAVFAPLGDRILFMSDARHTDRDRDDFDLYEASWSNGEISNIRALDALNTPNADLFATAADDGTIVFASDRPGGAGGNDLYQATPAEGGWQVRPLSEINSGTSDSNPFVFPDGNRMIFYSAREGGYGAVDLYVTHRASNGTWTTPINLGTEVNTVEGEYAPSLSADGRTLFFARGAEIMAIDVDAVTALDADSDRLADPR